MNKVSGEQVNGGKIALKISGRKGNYTDLFQGAANSACAVLGLNGNLFVEVDFVSGARIKELNAQFRNIDKATDVLSFPFLELKPFKYPIFDEKSFPLDINENGQVSLGSIVIYAAIVKKQAVLYGHSVERETVYLFVHGLLHLLGFDHIDDKDREIMRKTEEKIMEAVSLQR